MGYSFDLEERLIDFAAKIIVLSEELPNTVAGRHMSGQITHSGTAPALHYGEAQSGESRKDFVHKMKTALKELRETYNALRIIKKVQWISTEELAPLLDENNQLISIFVTSIKTANRNDEIVRKNKKKKPGPSDNDKKS